MSIVVKGLNYTYLAGTPYEKTALKNINIEIKKGIFTGIIGHTGSGKSTLVQHFNGLLKPQQGKVIIDGQDIWGKDFKRSCVRRQVGLVFQYPEYQLFEETVYREVAFGAVNAGVREPELSSRVEWALELVQLPFSKVKRLSPFDLSGGERRRVAIAGVLAMKPEYLILDEPAAGLDPRAREDILNHIYRLHRENNITTVLVSHSMEDIARLADDIVVMDKGGISFSGSPEEVFKEGERLKQIGLGLPAVTSLIMKLQHRGWKFEQTVFTVSQAEREILKALRGNDNA